MQAPRPSQPVAPQPASSPVAHAAVQQRAVVESPAPQYPLAQPASKGHGVPGAPRGEQTPALQYHPGAHGKGNEQVVLQVAISAHPKWSGQGCGDPGTQAPAWQVLVVSLAVAPLHVA